MYYRNHEGPMVDPVYEHMGHDMHGGHMHHDMHEGNMHHHMQHPDMHELHNMYPEVYRIMFPMVRRVSDHNRHRRITRELLDNMVAEVYDHMEPEELVRSDATCARSTTTSTEKWRCKKSKCAGKRS